MCTSKWYRNNILTAHAIVGNIVLSAPWKYSEAITKVSRKYSGIIRKVFEKYSQKYWKTIRKFFENYLKNWSANMCLNTCSKYSENIQIILRKYSESFQHFWRVWHSIELRTWLRTCEGRSKREEDAGERGESINI